MGPEKGKYDAEYDNNFFLFSWRRKYLEDGGNVLTWKDERKKEYVNHYGLATVLSVNILAIFMAEGGLLKL